MPRCDKNHTADTTKTAIVDGKFGQWCPEHIRGQQRGSNGASAQWHRDRGLVFVIALTIIMTALLCFYWYKWSTVPCSSFKTNPVLRGGYAPARCVK